MFRPIFIGDRLSAAGFRLGGAMTRVPEPGAEANTLRDALAEGELVVITAEVASKIPVAQLEGALKAVFPLVLVVPGICGGESPADIAGTLRRRLGMSE